MRLMFVSAAACLFTATAALAQMPVPNAPPSEPLMVSGPVQPAACAPCVISPCVLGKCEHGKPCTPVVTLAKKTVYSTVTREYCQPCRSFCDLVLRKCGLQEDCETGPTGETRSKTLLVKKLIPKCDEGCCSHHK